LVLSPAQLAPRRQLRASKNCETFCCDCVGSSASLI
jgi:hypothetical protein